MTSLPDDAAADRPADGAGEPADASSSSGSSTGSTASGGPASIDSAARPAAPAAGAIRDDEATAATEPMDAPRTPPVGVERDDVQVRARLVPRYGRFMVLGGILGAIGGWLWSRLGSSGPWLGAGPVIDTSAVVPFLVAVGALAGVVLGAVVAIALDRLVGRRRRTLTAERTRHHRGDLGD